MHRSTTTQRAARLFWSVVGGSLLVVSGVVLVWFLRSRHDSPMLLLDACLMMLRQVWGITLQQVTSPSVAQVFGLGLVVSIAWAGGGGLLAWWRTRRLLAFSAPYCPGQWPTLDTALAILPPERCRLRTLATTRPVACTVGLWRPHIVLSAGLIAALTPTELGSVLGHEWGHVRQRDPLRIALLQFWSMALWFLPIVRTLARDSARAMEDAADDVAVFLTDQPLELAAALVKTAKAQTRSSWALAPALGGEHTVTARVERLLALAPASSARQHTWTWVISAAIAMCLLALLSLPRHPGVMAMSVLPFVSQPALITCHIDTQQR